MAIKAKDLAKKIGVSEATLSLVLNGKEGISKKTRERVAQQIISLGYEDMFKNGIMQQESGSGNLLLDGVQNDKGCIGFVVYQDTGLFMENTPFFPLIIDGMDDVARKNGYRLLVINIRRNMELQVKLDYIRNSGCSGFVIYAPEFPEEEVDILEKLGIPFVLLDNYFPGKDINAVTLNNEQGIYTILKMLTGLGHQKIGYLGSGVDIQSFMERRNGYAVLMEQFGLEVDPEFFVQIGYPEDGAEQGMLRLLEEKKELPTAFICENDNVAYGAIAALQKKGYEVPKEVSVVGFSDRPICMYITPNITTLRIPRTRFGGEAVDMLINKVLSGNDDENSTVRTAISLRLIMRDSVGPAKEEK